MQASRLVHEPMSLARLAYELKKTHEKMDH